MQLLLPPNPTLLPQPPVLPHPQLLPHPQPLFSHPHPQLVADKSLILIPPKGFYSVSYVHGLALFPIFS